MRIPNNNRRVPIFSITLYIYYDSYDSYDRDIKSLNFSESECPDRFCRPMTLKMGRAKAAGCSQTRPREQTIGDWLETPVRDDTTASGVANRIECTISDVAENALRMEPGRLGTTDQRRIAAALEILGWERSKRTKHGRPRVRRTVASPD